MKKKRMNGNFISAIGILLLFCALALTAYNLWDAERAQRSAEEAAAKLEEYRLSADTVPDYVIDPDMDMPEVTIDGITYIGNIKVPAQGLDLPVITSWTYEYLKVAPCRYMGSVYKDNLIIAAHNYSRHFGRLHELDEGTPVQFVDMNGNEFNFEIAEIEILEPTQVEEMEQSDYDLTLFTCVGDGYARYAIRCNKVDDTR